LGVQTLPTAETITRLARQIDEAQLTLDELRRQCGCDTFNSAVVEPEKRHQTALEAAKMAYAHRLLRPKHLNDEEIFGEPAWDILLDLYVHQAQNEKVSVKSACIESGAPTTTALRWLNILEMKGLVNSLEDPDDSRRRLIRLTAEGYEAMTRYLNEIAR
jgi:DNA-binding MarR family transcriptional regulator